jgi:hypothetical protein
LIHAAHWFFAGQVQNLDRPVFCRFFTGPVKNIDRPVSAGPVRSGPKNLDRFQLCSYPYSVAVGDFNNDTRLDIVVANHGTNNLAVLLGHGNGTFASPILFSMNYGSGPFSVVIGDFNNDRKLDFAVANDGTDSLTILLQIC